MKWFDLPEKCKRCKWLKVLNLDMGGNSDMMCRKPHDEEAPCSKFKELE